MEAGTQAEFERCRDALVSHGREATRALLIELRDEDPRRVRTACDCLGHPTTRDADALPVLEEVAELPRMGSFATAAIARFGPQGVEALERLARQAEPVGRDALHALRMVCRGDLVPLLPTVIRALEEDQPWQRTYEAALIVWDLGPAGRPALGPLRRLLGSRDQDARRAAIVALMRIGARDPQSVSALLDLHRRGEWMDRLMSATALVRLGRHVRLGLDYLVSSLLDAPGGTSMEARTRKNVAALCLSDPQVFRPEYLALLQQAWNDLSEPTRRSVRRSIREAGFEDMGERLPDTPPKTDG